MAYLGQVDLYKTVMGFLKKVIWTKKQIRGLWTNPIAKAFKGYVGQFGISVFFTIGEVVEVVSQKRTTSITSLSNKEYTES